MKKHNYVILALLSVSLFACREKESTGNTSEDIVIANAATITDVNYGSDYKQRFDIYLPANRSAGKTPVLFLIHGGGWSAGDKNDYAASIPGLRLMFPTYAFVSVGYRLVANGQNRFPTQEEDAKACIEYVLNHNKEYHISQNFAVLGSSAGAHLALLYAYKYGNTSFQPKAVVDMVGPTELMQMYKDVGPGVKPLLISAVGDPATADSMLYKSSSPLNYVTRTSPPTLMLHGTADTVVPYSQATILRDKLNLNQVDNAYKIYPNEGHGLEGVGADALAQIKAFLELRLK